MNETHQIPCLPESAPFTAEQRAYLNGFLAGLFSRAAAQPVSAFESGISLSPCLTPLTILFGSQTGNAENLARRLAKVAGQRGFAPAVQDLAQYPPAQLAAERQVLVVTSTYGDGEPPDNAKNFWEFLARDSAPRLTELKFSICALGDSNYPRFCGFGRELDARLTALGAECIHPRADCDVAFEEPFSKWMEEVLTKLQTPAASRPRMEIISPSVEENAPAPVYSRANPFPAALMVNRKLNGPGSTRDTRHLELTLEGSGLKYEAGDALGVWPTNCPALVEELLQVLNCSGKESVPVKDAGEVPLREALLRCCEITRLPQSLLRAVGEKTGDAELLRLASPTANGEFSRFQWGREIIDLLLAHPAAKFTAKEFVGLLKKLQPRLYSIASSPRRHPGQVHLCVAVVRYESLGRVRKGVCSTFLAERVPVGGRVPVFVQPNKNFRPPANPDAPMILVGPGTGLAPFRAFLEERQVNGARGKNWLFFGSQKSATDFLYQDEIDEFRRAGILTRLDLAWSRDQAQKIYVQHRMREHAAELFDWLEAGAHFYVCGDAQQMARDVDAALHEIVQTAGGRTSEQAAEYVRRLKNERRYQRDVY
jgi:sulfite reductase (NADPH) flavoprotein alpha-component